MTSDTTPVLVIGTGARTPLGLRAAASAAAVRADMSAVMERVLLADRPWTLRHAALDPKLDDRIVGAARFDALAGTACQEACAPLVTAGFGPIRAPLFLALPEYRPGFEERNVEFLYARAPEWTPTLDISEINVVPRGHAAGLLALEMASERIRQAAADICLVGGIDSYYHPDTLAWLDRHRQLSGGDARSAFVPGEGAAFVVLASGRAQEQLGIAPLLRVAAVASDHEVHLIKTDDVCLGEGLTRTVQAVTDRLTDGLPVDHVICDLNGERYRSEEWGFVCLRLAERFRNPTGYLSPADCWGDMGAASGGLFLMLACEIAKRGYENGPRTMLWASSEGGLRSAAIVEMTGHA